MLIVGAGLSGIGAAYHLQAELPGQDLRDPRGARRDRRHLGPVPLPGHPLGLRHVHARLLVPALDGGEGDRRRPVDPQLRPRDRRASTASTGRSASATASSAPSGRPRTRAGRSRSSAPTPARRSQLTCGFLHVCTGYYRYDEGYTPEFAGTERFAGQIVHPQHWPEDLDYAGKRVVVIGSGATAVTLVPAMAETRRARDDAAALAELRRLAARPRTRIANCAAPLCCRRRLAYPIVRWKNVLLTMRVFQLSRRRAGAGQAADPPRASSASCRPATTSTPTSSPRYNPWDQRCASCPTATCSRRSATGRASVVTDRIETFTEDGLRLESGAELEADVIVTATGLNLLPLGGIDARRRRRARSSSPRRWATRG